MKLIKTTSIFLIILSSVSTLHADAAPVSLEYNLYYPVLTGSYQDIKLRPRATPPMNNPCEIGTIYLNDENEPMYCFRSLLGSTGEWSPLSGPWIREEDTVRLSPYYHAEDLKIGLGSTTPPFKLTILSQGGILARGTINTGDSLPELTYTSPYWNPHASMLWNPRKAVLRAGINQGPLWNENPSYTGTYSVAFGNSPMASGHFSSIGGGIYNVTTRDHAVVAGGYSCGTYDTLSAVAGGSSNHSFSSGAYVGGGEQNSTNHYYATVFGGYANQALGLGSVIVGGKNNRVGTLSTIIGGERNITGNEFWNSAENMADWGSDHAEATEETQIIGGGLSNKNGNSYTAIGGGTINLTKGEYSTVVGGKGNIAGGHFSSVLGGESNQTNGRGSVVSGGLSNNALARFAFIAGGEENTINANYSAILGGARNTAGGIFSVVTGGSDNVAAGDYSWAGGKNMQLVTLSGQTPHRSFLWGYSDTPVQVSTPDAFIIYSGHVGLNTNNKVGTFAMAAYQNYDFINFSSSSGQAGDLLTVTQDGKWGIDKRNPNDTLDFGNIAHNARLTTGGQWIPGSSRSFKENIRDLSSQEALTAFDSLKPVTFNYKNTPQDAQIGFIAEDVPELVSTPDHKTLTRTPLLSILTKIIQDQDRILEEQNREIEILKRRVQNLQMPNHD